MKQTSWSFHKYLFTLGASAAVALACEGVPMAAADTVTYQVVTNEISTKQPSGTKSDVYRFDPSVYVVQEGDNVVLQIRGLKGHDHPIVLEGYDLHGVVHKNQVTTLQFQATKPGFFHLVCTAHADAAHEGPMEGYLVVVPKTART